MTDQPLVPDSATPAPEVATSAALVDRKWVGAIILAAIVAIPAAFLTIAYIGGVRWLTHVVWDDLAAATGLPREVVVVAIPTIGGILVGLCIRYLPGGGGPEPAAGHGLGGDEHEGLRGLPGVVLASVISLVAGASLGPEGPLVTIIGGLATWVALRLRLPEQMGLLLSLSGISSLTAGIFGSPLASGLLLAETAPFAGVELYRRIIPALAAGTVGYIIFDALIGPPIVPIFGPSQDPGLWPFFIALAFGVVGGFLGVLYIEGFHRLRDAVRRFDGQPVLKAAVGGFAIGIVALGFGELTLFSGEHEIYEAVEQAGTLGVGGLCLLLLGKLIASLVSLVCGFRGGRIFPVMFLGGVLGLVVSAIFPAIPAPIAVASGMGALGVSVLRIPLFMVIFVAVFTAIDLIPYILVAVVTSYAVTVGRREL
jgi:H+/Cl- antiporter ClcA